MTKWKERAWNFLLQLLGIMIIITMSVHLARIKCTNPGTTSSSALSFVDSLSSVQHHDPTLEISTVQQQQHSTTTNHETEPGGGPLHECCCHCFNIVTFRWMLLRVYVQYSVSHNIWEWPGTLCSGLVLPVHVLIWTSTSCFFRWPPLFPEKKTNRW